MVDPSEQPEVETGDDTHDRRVLYPVLDGDSETVLHIAASIAHSMNALLMVGHVDTDSAELSMEASRKAAHTKRHANSEPLPDFQFMSRSIAGQSPLDAVETALATSDFDLVVFDDAFGDAIDADLATAVECDTVVVNEKTHLGDIDTVLVPVAGGPHSETAVRIAGALAAANDATVEFMHVLDPEPTDDETASARELLADSEASLPAAVRSETTLLEAADLVDAIIDESESADVTVIGAPTKSRLREFVFGSDAAAISDAAQNTVLTVRTE